MSSNYFEKIKYYKKRLNDMTLTDGQRLYAHNFLSGAAQAEFGAKKSKPYVRTTKHVEIAKSAVETNKRLGGDVAYFKGQLALTEFLVNKSSEEIIKLQKYFKLPER